MKTSKMNILLVAMDVELNSLIEHFKLLPARLNNSSKAKIYTCNINKNWLIVMSGVGQINTSIALSEIQTKYDIENIFQFGVGGGISKDIMTGEYAIADRIVEHDAIFEDENSKTLMGTGELFLSKQEDERLSPYIQTSSKTTTLLTEFCELNQIKFHIGTIASGASFIANKARKIEIANKTQAIMVDMEAAAASYFAQMNQINYGFLKVCSDSLGGELDKEYKNFISENVKNVVNLLRFLDEAN